MVAPLLTEEEKKEISLYIIHIQVQQKLKQTNFHQTVLWFLPIGKFQKTCKKYS